MGKLTVFNSVTLDGVMQAPASPDEDRRGGFAHGGWTNPYADEVIAGLASEGPARETAFLFGRVTYEDFASFWPHQPEQNPFAAVLSNSQKYVVSRTLAEPLPWRNSTLLKGDAAEAVARLKQQTDADLMIFGSGQLIQSLMPHHLIDKYVLLIYPLVLGSGRRLFVDGVAYTTLRLLDSKTSTTGVIIATYADERAVPGAGKSE